MKNEQLDRIIDGLKESTQERLLEVIELIEQLNAEKDSAILAAAAERDDYEESRRLLKKKLALAQATIERWEKSYTHWEETEDKEFHHPDECFNFPGEEEREEIDPSDAYREKAEAAIMEDWREK